jgi:TLC domain
MIVVRKLTLSSASPVFSQHHFVAIAYLSGPLAWPEYRWFMGACLSVEINTWFLILRRVLYKRKDRIHSFVMELVSISFYATWIVIRIVLYPMIMYIFIEMAYDRVMETGILWHWPMVFLPVHFFLCVLNLKWSYDLFLPIVTKYVSQSKCDVPVGVSRGL